MRLVARVVEAAGCQRFIAGMVVPFITSMTMDCFSTICVAGESASVSIPWSASSLGSST